MVFLAGLEMCLLLGLSWHVTEELVRFDKSVSVATVCRLA